MNGGQWGPSHGHVGNVSAIDVHTCRPLAAWRRVWRRRKRGAFYDGLDMMAPDVDKVLRYVPLESGELVCWLLSGPGPGIGEGIHCWGLYGWMALAGVDTLNELELYDKAETGVFEL